MRLEALSLYSLPALAIALIGAAIIFNIVCIGRIKKKETENYNKF